MAEATARPDAAERIVVRSYRAVFALERRIYRIDNLTLNPSGVPLRGIVYAVAVALAVAVCSTLPVVGLGLRLLPWFVRLVGLPLALAAFACVVRIEGRVFHQAVGALLGFLLLPRERAGLGAASSRCGEVRAVGEVVFACCGSEGYPVRLRYRGPGVALVRGLAAPSQRGRCLTAFTGPGPAKAVAVPAGGVLELRPRPAGDGC